MGKVGGSSISASLRASGVSNYHFHQVEPDGVYHQLVRQIANPGLPVPDTLLEGLLARNAAEVHEQVDVVTTLREPVSRNISAVFENAVPGSEASQIIRRIKNYPCNIPDAWFGKNFTPFTGIDLEAMAAEPHRDHHIVEKGRFRVLIMKVETKLERQASILSDFVGKRVTISLRNMSRRKWYSGIYDSIVDDIETTCPQFVQQSRQAAYYRAFYAPEERQRLEQVYR